MSQLNDDELSKTILDVINERHPDDSRQLIELLKKRFPLKEERIQSCVLKLHSQGRITLESPKYQPPHKLASYLGSTHALWYWAAILTATITLAAVLLVPANFFPWNYVREVFGAIFVLWLPGYTLTKALFPLKMPIKPSTNNLEKAEIAALSIGMSMAMVPLVGLLLNYTPWGIRLGPIIISLYIITLIFATVAIVRGYSLTLKT